MREKRQPPVVSEGTARIDKERSVPLLKHFGDERVSRIDAPAISNYQLVRAKLVSPRTVNLELEFLRCVLKEAKVWERVVHDVKPLPENNTDNENGSRLGRALDDAQEQLLFRTARSKPEWDAAFLAALAAANTTMRGCELKGLRLRHVNLMEREVNIRRSKTKKGNRDIPFNDGAMWAFARLVERANALGSVQPDHFLFPRCLSRNTKVPNRQAGYDPTKPQKTWRSAWRSLVKETARRAAESITDERERQKAMAPFVGLRFHDLRHLAITKLAESLASDQTIMSIAGHMDRKMMELYSHIRDDVKQKAVDAIRSYVPEEIPVPATQRVQ
ncbi:MAG TPA: site-specific integrase [Bryobacteraceae bacterium]|nr:site-specific integrase [Bryobacteraceae bacterium]